ncbi:MAG: thiamine diphosphokinase [Ruminococcus sp.]|nr:thiamine diphosphokinase [Ruminococcus sp.]
MNKWCAIFAGGDMPDMKPYSLPVYYKNFECVICADSGYKHAKRLGIVPDVIVGDFDSYDGELPEGAEVIRTIPEKDDTDTLMAIKKAISLGYKELFLFGALGGKRFEHTVANIQAMMYAREHGCKLGIYGESTLLLQGAEDGEQNYLREDEGTYLSVFAMTESADIEYMRGVKYPLENYRMVQSFPIGVSNEITGTTADIKLKSGVVLIVMTAM